MRGRRHVGRLFMAWAAPRLSSTPCFPAAACRQPMTQRVPTRFTASARLIVLILAIAITGTGCGKIFKRDKDNAEGQPVEALYEKAHGAMTKGNWDRAETTFRQLI